ncbi:MAG: hypothetical protein MI864_02440 [Pseudomonadales bacterium]|nr:hypothetical protein [Pseudomonadales bacterium]
MNQIRLKKILLVNVIFSFVCAFELFVFSETWARLLGSFPPIIYEALGVFLAFFGLDVLYVATRKAIDFRFAKWIMMADWAWVVSTIIILPVFAAWFSLTGLLVWSAIAVFVAVVAWLELKALYPDFGVRKLA